jgi:site-specific DNA-methyltransferase (adenine-specific)
VAKASPGGDDYPHLVFSEPIIADAPSVCTETYLIVSTVQNLTQAQNLKKYISTKFFRFLVLLIKNTQDVPKKVYSYVPQQNLDEEWNDEKLFSKYGIDESERRFIDALVKDVDWRDICE